MTTIRVLLAAILAISPFVLSGPAVAAPKKNVYSGTEGGACHVVSGPNKGKTGTYDAEGDCCNEGPGGWGCTGCKNEDGTSNGKCADGAALGGNPHEILGDILVGQLGLFKDQQQNQQQILTRLNTLMTRVESILSNISGTGTSSISSLLGGIRADVSDLRADFRNLDFCTTPDLVPSPPIPGADPRFPANFCHIVDGNLIVQVRNQAGAKAGPSITRVTFATDLGPVVRNLDTGEVAGFGGIINLSTPVPAGCFSTTGVFPGPCNFHITVDADAAVAEGNNEGNNDADGACVPVL